MKGASPGDWRDAVYYHYYESSGHGVAKHDGVRTQRYKLIRFYELDQWELFDLDQDPQEMNSVYDDPAYAEIRRQMHQRLDAQRQKFQVPDTNR